MPVVRAFSLFDHAFRAFLLLARTDLALATMVEGIEPSLDFRRSRSWWCSGQSRKWLRESVSSHLHLTWVYFVFLWLVALVAELVVLVSFCRRVQPLRRQPSFAFIMLLDSCYIYISMFRGFGGTIVHPAGHGHRIEYQGICSFYSTEDCFRL